MLCFQLVLFGLQCCWSTECGTGLQLESAMHKAAFFSSRQICRCNLGSQVPLSLFTFTEVSSSINTVMVASFGVLIVYVSKEVWSPLCLECKRLNVIPSVSIPPETAFLRAPKELVVLSCPPFRTGHHLYCSLCDGQISC